MAGPFLLLNADTLFETVSIILGNNIAVVQLYKNPMMVSWQSVAEEESRAGTLQETFARFFTAFRMTNYGLDNIYIVALFYIAHEWHGLSQMISCNADLESVLKLFWV